MNHQAISALNLYAESAVLGYAVSVLYIKWTQGVCARELETLFCAALVHFPHKMGSWLSSEVTPRSGLRRRAGA